MKKLYAFCVVTGLLGVVFLVSKDHSSSSANYRKVYPVASVESGSISINKFSIVTGNRNFPQINALLTDVGTPPESAMLPSDILARIPKNYLMNITSVTPTLRYGSFTDNNVVQAQAHGQKAFGFVNKMVWAVTYDNVPPSRYPPMRGPFRYPGAPTPGLSTNPHGDMILLLFDADTGQELQEIGTPEPN